MEEILLAGSPSSVALRASIVIGPRSRPFRFLVRLVERLPVLALPGWRDNLTSPIDERDIAELLARGATNDADRRAGARRRRSRHRLLRWTDRSHPGVDARRPADVRLGRVSLTPIASHIAAVIAGEEYELIGPLMESLETDLLPRDDEAARLLGVKLHSLDAAIDRALRIWEQTEPVSAR